MSPVATGRPGRPAAATREDALALGNERFLAGERVDVKAIAQELGLARATMHRWFGTREGFIGVMLATLAEERLAAIRAKSPAAALQRCSSASTASTASSRPQGGCGSCSRRTRSASCESSHRAAGSSNHASSRRSSASFGPSQTRVHLPPPSPRRASPTRSFGWPRRSSTTTRSSASEATPSDCARSRRRFSACRSDGGLRLPPECDTIGQDVKRCVETAADGAGGHGRLPHDPGGEQCMIE